MNIDYNPNNIVKKCNAQRFCDHTQPHAKEPLGANDLAAAQQAIDALMREPQRSL